MGRLACISLPAFPLQLLLKREPLWQERPVAVVKEDRPQGEILWVNELARRSAVLPGMRYAAGLSLASELCAAVVTEGEIETCVAALTERLRKHSPHVEPGAHDPGVFILDASGLRYLHPTLTAWAQDIHAELKDAGFLARIVAGFTRFGTTAIALSRQGPRTIVLETEPQERARAETVRLDRLRIEPKVRDDLHALGIDTLKDLLKLPPAGLRRRYGKEIHHLHQAAREDWHKPLQPQAAAPDFKQHTLLDYPERDANRLLFLVKRMLDPMLEQLVEQKQALSALTIRMKLDSPKEKERTERLKPAEPTIDIRQLLNLAMLRLDAVHLKAGVVEFELDAEHVAASYEQLSLFQQQKKRDLAAAKRAFARLRAELGDGAVLRAELSDGHLPEASFRWTPLDAPCPPSMPRVARRMLVRRILQKPKVLPHRPRHEDDGWQLRGRDDPPVEEVLGPYVVSGGWWRKDVHREYHFIRNLKGEWLWVYYDKFRRRWYLQGRVE